jgi:hypothetical protein
VEEVVVEVRVDGKGFGLCFLVGDPGGEVVKGVGGIEGRECNNLGFVGEEENEKGRREAVEVVVEVEEVLKGVERGRDEVGMVKVVEVEKGGGRLEVTSSFFTLAPFTTSDHSGRDPPLREG